MKKILSVLVTLVCVMALTTTGFAATANLTPRIGGPIAEVDRYSYINYFIVNPSISSTSASCSAQASLTGSYKATLTIVLEVSKNGGGYGYDSTLASKTSTGTLISASGSKSNLNSLYSYRIVTTLSVYDSYGNYIDGDVAYSY